MSNHKAKELSYAMLCKLYNDLAKYAIAQLHAHDNQSIQQMESVLGHVGYILAYRFLSQDGGDDYVPKEGQWQVLTALLTPGTSTGINTYAFRLVSPMLYTALLSIKEDQSDGESPLGGSDSGDEADGEGGEQDSDIGLPPLEQPRTEGVQLPTEGGRVAEGGDGPESDEGEGPAGGGEPVQAEPHTTEERDGEAG